MQVSRGFASQPAKPTGKDIKVPFSVMSECSCKMGYECCFIIRLGLWEW